MHGVAAPSRSGCSSASAASATGSLSRPSRRARSSSTSANASRSPRRRRGRRAAAARRRSRSAGRRRRRPRRACPGRRRSRRRSPSGARGTGASPRRSGAAPQVGVQVVGGRGSIPPFAPDTGRTVTPVVPDALEAPSRARGPRPPSTVQPARIRRPPPLAPSIRRSITRNPGRPVTVVGDVRHVRRLDHRRHVLRNGDERRAGPLEGLGDGAGQRGRLRDRGASSRAHQGGGEVGQQEVDADGRRLHNQEVIRSAP